MSVDTRDPESGYGLPWLGAEGRGGRTGWTAGQHRKAAQGIFYRNMSRILKKFENFGKYFLQQVHLNQ